ncbi:MAG: tetratricopeptide repeat protein [Burkholderiales bacterium]|nr:tetratricopeptide repeat protein [Burkholderiales bacterium]
MFQQLLARHLALAGLLSGLLLAGCASVPMAAAPAHDQAPPAASDDNDGKSGPSEEADARDKAHKDAEEASYPKQELTPELLLGFLVGDFAAEEGNSQLAAETWLELARRTHDPRAAERALELAAQAGRYDNLLMAGHMWRDYAPTSLQARYTYIAILVSGRQLAEAEKEITQWLLDDPSTAPAILLDLHSMLAKYPDKAEALALTRRVAALHNDLPEAPMAVAFAAQDAGEQAAAIEAADQAVRARPDWVGAIIFRSTLTEKDKPADSALYLEAAQKRLPQSLQLRVALARAYSSAGRYDDARRLYQKLGSEYPKEIEFPVGEALADMQVHRLAEAEGALNRALTLQPRHPGVLHYHLGLIAEEQSHYDKARTEYEAVDEPEYRVQTATRLAHVEAKTGHHDAAFEQLANIPNRSKAEQVAHIQLEAQLWSDLKDLPQARQALDRGLADHADNPDLLYDRSLIFDRMGDVTDAESDLRRFLTLNPDSPTGLNALGYTLANRTNRLDEAEQLIRQALAKEPDNPVIQDSFGWVLVRRGKLQEGSQWLAKAFAAMPDPEIAAHYGEALWRSGHQGEARKVWDQGRKLDPNQEVLAETVHRLTGQ